MKINKSREQLSKQAIADAEKKLGVKLPEMYREFLLTHNGGKPQASVFKYEEEGKSNRSMVDFFLCLKQGDVYDLIENTKRLKGRIPVELLPIAIDPFGNMVCLAVSGDKTGSVFFWDHEEEVGDDEVPGYANVYLIAKTFKEFLDGLQPL